MNVLSLAKTDLWSYNNIIQQTCCYQWLMILIAIDIAISMTLSVDDAKDNTVTCKDLCTSLNKNPMLL